MVLSREQVVRVLDGTHNSGYRALLATLYSTGAHAAEPRLWRLEDIDSQRMLPLTQSDMGEWVWSKGARNTHHP